MSVLNSLPAAVYLLDRLAPAGSQVISHLGAPVDVVVVVYVVVVVVVVLPARQASTCRLSGNFSF